MHPQTQLWITESEELIKKRQFSKANEKTLLNVIFICKTPNNKMGLNFKKTTEYHWQNSLHTYCDFSNGNISKKATESENLKSNIQALLFMAILINTNAKYEITIFQ